MFGIGVGVTDLPVLQHTGGTPTPTPAPSFSVQPSISGTPQVGVSFVGTPGTASNTTSHSYRWLLSATSGGTYTPISGATSASYTPVSGDETKYLKFEDTAIGAGGSTVATTTFAGPVAAAAVGISAPVLTKTNSAGAQLAFNVTFDATVVAGMYAHLMLSTSSTFPAISNLILINGDSFEGDGSFYNGYYVGAWKAAHSAYNIANIAQGGRQIGTVGGTTANTLVYREDEVIRNRPQIYFAGDGANDLSTYASGDAWADAILAHFQRIKDALPGVILVGRTVIAQYGNATHNSYRTQANIRMRAALSSGFFTALADFAADSHIGTDAAMTPSAAGPTCITLDGTHLYDIQGATSGMDYAAPIFAAAMNTAVAAMPALLREQTISLASGDLINGPTFTILANQPAGPIFAKLIVESDEPRVSPGSNVITETVAASAAAFDPTTATNTYGIVSNANKTFKGTDQAAGYPTNASVISNRPLTAATSYIEFTYNLPAIRGGTGGRLGLVNASWDHSLYHGVGGDADSWGVIDGGFVYNDGSAVAYPPSFQTNGTVVGLLTQKAAKKSWLNIGGTWYPDTPTFASDGSITSGTGYSVGVSGPLYFAVSAGADEGFTVNAAGSYLRTPPTNVILGWS